MKKWLYWKILALMLILGCFWGCGGDDFGGNDGSIADSGLDNEDQIPTITIEKIKTEKLEGSKTVWWRLNADPAPKTDVAVRVGDWWVTVPKSKNNSETFKDTASWGTLMINIKPLPMVSIVGKGLVVDLETLQKYLPANTRGGHRIPEDFNFPLYTVGTPSQVVVVGEEREEIAAAGFSSAAPASGSEIAVNGTITVIFDNDPGTVTASEGIVLGAGKTRKIAGPFTPGALSLKLTWTNGGGGLTLSYNVLVPDITAPTVTGGTVEDGDEDVDTQDINRDGVIEITFSEEVVGNIMLQTEQGDDVGWIGTVDGNKGRLELVRGKEIGNGTTYVIVGKVSDAAGNVSEIHITFVASRIVALENIVAPENLTAVWLFEAGKGHMIFDSSGNEHHGRIDGDARWVEGKSGTALELAGQAQSVVIENHIAFNFEENMTVTGWFYPNDVLTNRSLITKKDSFSVGFVGIAGFLEFVTQDDATFDFLFWFNNELRKWHHFAVTFDGTVTKFYINGRRSVWMEGNVPIAPSEADLVIGGGFSGRVDEIALYNRALTDNEVTEIFENGFVQ